MRRRKRAEPEHAKVAIREGGGEPRSAYKLAELLMMGRGVPLSGGLGTSAAAYVAGLMAAGAAINGFGIRNPAPAGRHLGPGAEQPPPESGSGTPSGPVQVAAEDFRKRQPQADPTGPARPD